MKLNMTVETHKDKAGNWIAQVLLAGRVIHEQTGPVSESQAIANAADSFAALLMGALDRQFEYETTDVD